MGDKAFEAQTLAEDLTQVRQIYADFFAGLSEEDWRLPQGDGDHEWNTREVVAHLGALNQLLQDSIQAARRGEAISDPALPDRFAFERFNRIKIDERLHMPVETLEGALLEALTQSIETTRSLGPGELDCTVTLPIYNRPISVGEMLGIQVFHSGFIHAAQVAEPAGVPPLWTHLPPEVRHRVITRFARALSLLYRQDLGGELRAVLALQVAGQGGGSWYVELSPEDPGSQEGDAVQPDLRLWFRDTATLFRMFTGRLNILGAILTRRLRIRGDVRLFLRMGKLFSVGQRG
ncbi:MAG TPA: DinB family protein [Anaerolineales bacterium]